MKISLNLDNLGAGISSSEIFNLQPQISKIHNELHDKQNGAYRNWTGWLNLPLTFPKSEIDDIVETARYIRENCDALIVLGTGGSYLGAHAVTDLLCGKDFNLYGRPQIIFLGNALNAHELENALELIKSKSVAVNVISKSGTTLEPAVAFGVLYDAMAAKYKKPELMSRIICTTDVRKGTLRQFADINGFKSFTVPDDVGGRYSVLTSVGLFPIACAGVDIKQLIEGARVACETYNNPDIRRNPCYRYAVARYLLSKQYTVDMFTFFNPNADKFGAWLVQLFGESEGKNGKGVFPACAVYPRDLHSLGQFVQEGSKSLFETFIHFHIAESDITLHNSQWLNAEGRTINEINAIVYNAAVQAHKNGGTSVISIEMNEINTQTVGELIFFFELACAVYCMLLGVDPFNQPGVEEYKKIIKKTL